MQRVTITLDEELAEEVDRLVKDRGYQNRSEAIRDLTRRGIRQSEEERGEDGSCIAALVYVYDHDKRDLAQRLTHIFHDHHDLTISSMHVHLDHSACIELNVLRGEGREVRRLADTITAERGVRYGRLVMAPIDPDGVVHTHGRGGRSHSHTHVRKAG